MIIYLTEQAILKAKQYEEAILKLPCMNKPNYTKYNSEHRYFKGYLGEWAVCQCLRKLGITFVWKKQITNKPDDGDFFIKGKSFDVKTSSKDKYDTLMFPAAQLKHHRDFYIATRLNLEERRVEIFGFIDEESLKKVKIRQFIPGIPTVAIEYSNLNPIENLKCEMGL